jgi:hypothetical protein
VPHGSARRIVIRKIEADCSYAGHAMIRYYRRFARDLDGLDRRNKNDASDVEHTG